MYFSMSVFFDKSKPIISRQFKLLALLMNDSARNLEIVMAIAIELLPPLVLRNTSALAAKDDPQSIPH
jgi:hypothetical protein